ncbi:MAG TPA: hypothetical protein VLA26_06725, partial [Gammaproteobacteria bacterium]|nr:hypothetical protein [Gammaproteobacteria bacterium]
RVDGLMGVRMKDSGYAAHDYSLLPKKMNDSPVGAGFAREPGYHRPFAARGRSYRGYVAILK